MVLIKFQSEESGDFVMFAEVATQLLRLMGMSGNTEGAVDADGIGAALSKLESALQRTPATSGESNDSEGEQPAVGLATRAGPLLDMLKRAKETNSYVMWRPE